jgi:quercetin dioxygenase-like cupin family protein
MLVTSPGASRVELDMRNTAPSTLRAVTTLGCCSILSLSDSSFATRAQETPTFRSDVIMQVPIGRVEGGNYALRATITTMEPFAKIPPHIHQYGGIRYALEGAITINWKDGGSQTFTQGSTYFEGPGQNHPPGVMAASNPTDKTTKILLIEWVPVD